MTNLAPQMIGEQQWTSYGTGRVEIVEGLPVFPKIIAGLPKVKTPGVYRLLFDDGYMYIGETDDLPRRFREYRRPTRGTEQEHVLRFILVNAGGARIEVLTGDQMNSRQARRKLERSEIESSKQHQLLNQCGSGYPHYLKFKVKYYEEMLDKASSELRTAGHSHA